MVNVSALSISYAIKVIRGGCEDVMAAVESGGLAVSTAAALTRLPQEEQAQAVAGVREMRGGGRKEPARSPSRGSFRVEMATPREDGMVLGVFAGRGAGSGDCGAGCWGFRHAG